MFKIERKIVKEVKEVLTFTNYAEYVLVQELHRQEIILAREDREAEDLNVATTDFIEATTRVDQLKASIRATKEDNDLPF